MEAVRRAYAEVLLSTTREAAARVLAAERRAAVLAGAVASGRDDAVAALLRLKAVSDAKIKEAELQSLAYVKRIQELEMQLSNAQSSISSLEGELERVHTELNQAGTLAKENRTRLSTAQKTDDRGIGSYHSKIHVQDRNKSPASSRTNCVPRNTKEAENMKSLQELHNFGHDLASSGMTHKEPNIYCSKYTKHTCSLGKQNRSVETSLGQTAGKAGQLKSLTISGKKCTAKNSCSLEAEVFQIVNLTHCKRKRSKRSGSICKHAVNKVQRKTEYETPDTSDGNGCMLLLQAVEHDLSPVKIFDRQSGNPSAEQKDGLHMLWKQKLNQCSTNSCEGDTLEVKTVQMRKAKRSNNINDLQHGGIYSRGAVKSGRTPLKEINGNSLDASKSSSVTMDDAQVGVPGQHATEAMMDLTDPVCSLFDSDSRSLQTLEPITDGSMPLDLWECRTQENNASDKNEDHVCNLVTDKVDGAPVISSSTKEENAQNLGTQCIVYKFNRRKRKSDHLGNNTDESLPDKSICLLGPAEDQEYQRKSQVPLTESPQSNRRILEVAQQLVSLSEK